MAFTHCIIHFTFETLRFTINTIVQKCIFGVLNNYVHLRCLQQICLEQE